MDIKERILANDLFNGRESPVRFWNLVGLHRLLLCQAMGGFMPRPVRNLSKNGWKWSSNFAGFPALQPWQLQILKCVVLGGISTTTSRNTRANFPLNFRSSWEFLLPPKTMMLAKACTSDRFRSEVLGKFDRDFKLLWRFFERFRRVTMNYDIWTMNCEIWTMNCDMWKVMLKHFARGWHLEAGNSENSWLILLDFCPFSLLILNPKYS